MVSVEGCSSRVLSVPARHSTSNVNSPLIWTSNPKKLFNHAEADFEVQPGDRIAQFILERIYTPEVVEVDDLDATARAGGGFGSTGVKAVGVEN